MFYLACPHSLLLLLFYKHWLLKGSYIDTASRKNQAERCIKTAAKIISPAIENTFAAGYDWYVLGFIVNLLLNFEAVALDINTLVC